MSRMVKQKSPPLRVLRRKDEDGGANKGAAVDVQQALLDVLGRYRDRVPYDMKLIGELVTQEVSAIYDEDELMHATTALLDEQRIACYWLGDERYLKRVHKTIKPSEAVDRLVAVKERDGQTLEQRYFEKQIEADIAHEKLLLYRILVVLGLIVFLILCREMMMIWLSS